MTDRNHAGGSSGTEEAIRKSHLVRGVAVRGRLAGSAGPVYPWSISSAPDWVFYGAIAPSSWSADHAGHQPFERLALARASAVLDYAG